MSLFEEMCWKRSEWTRTIEKAKAIHWKEFLDRASEGRLWKAASYMGPRESYSSIPALKVGSEEVSDNESKARILMESFFPQMADAEEEMITPQREEIHWEPITEQEIFKALRIVKATTAPGEDGIPTLV